MRFWPQALVFQLEGMLVETDGAPAPARHGGRGFLETLDGKPWGMVTTMATDEAERRLAEAELPAPPVLLAARDLSDGTAFREAAEALGAEPEEIDAFTGTSAAVTGAAACGMQIVHSHRLRVSTIGASSSGWIVDLGQMHSDIRAAHWAVTIIN